MKLTSFIFGIFYSTVYIHDIENPPNDYQDFRIEDAHCQQGFMWLPVGVAAFSIHDVGEWDTVVFLNEPVQLAVDAVRAIQIPFTVFGNKGVFIGSGGVVDFTLDIPPGNYTVVVEQGYRGDPPGDIETGDIVMWCKIWFNLATEEVEAKILVQDDGLDPVYPLRLDKLPD